MTEPLVTVALPFEQCIALLFAAAPTIGDRHLDDMDGEEREQAYALVDGLMSLLAAIVRQRVPGGPEYRWVGDALAATRAHLDQARAERES